MNQSPLQIVAGATSQTVNVFIADSSATYPKGKTGLAYNTASLTAYYVFPGQAAVAITLATLASASAAWSSGGFKEIDATHCPGLYRLDIPNAVIAAANGRFVTIFLTGASGMADTMIEIELTAVDNQDAFLGMMAASNGVETSVTLKQALRVMLAALSGKLTISGNTVTCRDPGDSANRISATTDGSGQRTSVTLNA
jgi:hypothetical protein